LNKARADVPLRGVQPIVRCKKMNDEKNVADAAHGLIEAGATHRHSQGTEKNEAERNAENCHAMKPRTTRARLMPNN
jgi:hypothetical protein